MTNCLTSLSSSSIGSVFFSLAFGGALSQQGAQDRVPTVAVLAMMRGNHLRFDNRANDPPGDLDLQVARLGHADDLAQGIEPRVLLKVDLEMLELRGAELLQIAVIFVPLLADLERPALLVGDQEAVIGRLVVLQ